MTLRPLGRASLLAVAFAPALLGIGAQDGKKSGGAPAGTPGSLSLDEIRQMLSAPGANEPFVPEAPFGIHTELATVIPATNPLTKVKVELGRQLYFDKRLSRDGSVSCASCHDPARGWTDHAPVSTGIHGAKGNRSAPTVLNRVLGKTQFWDGRAASLEDQALGPMANPIEMGFTVDEAAGRLNEVPGYKLQFEKVFGGPANGERIAMAIAAFERTVVVAASPNDYWEDAMVYEGAPPDPDETAEDKAFREKRIAAAKAHPMSDSAKRGRALFFGKAQCSLCHAGENFTDEQFHNIGIGMEVPQPDLGRGKVSGKKDETGAFKTPTVRNVKDTGPYMHDGSLKTLREVIDHYDKGGVGAPRNPALSGKIHKLDLTEAEKKDLEAFLVDGLSGPAPKIDVPKLP
ncbi:MAG TPA: cytochrome c peroxidase [Planctomycetota bacterium]|nr:cytochrome c peroxidase [Planctomycetota bacterium]